MIAAHKINSLPARAIGYAVFVLLILWIFLPALPSIAYLIYNKSFEIISALYIFGSVVFICWGLISAFALNNRFFSATPKGLIRRFMSDTIQSKLSRLSKARLRFSSLFNFLGMALGWGFFLFVNLVADSPTTKISDSEDQKKIISIALLATDVMAAQMFFMSVLCVIFYGISLIIPNDFSDIKPIFIIFYAYINFTLLGIVFAPQGMSARLRRQPFNAYLLSFAMLISTAFLLTISYSAMIYDTTLSSLAKSLIAVSKGFDVFDAFSSKNWTYKDSLLTFSSVLFSAACVQTVANLKSLKRDDADYLVIGRTLLILGDLGESLSWIEKIERVDKESLMTLSIIHMISEDKKSENECSKGYLSLINYNLDVKYTVEDVEYLKVASLALYENINNTFIIDKVFEFCSKSSKPVLIAAMLCVFILRGIRLSEVRENISNSLTNEAFRVAVPIFYLTIGEARMCQDALSAFDNDTVTDPAAIAIISSARLLVDAKLFSNNATRLNDRIYSWCLSDRDRLVRAVGDLNGDILQTSLFLQWLLAVQFTLSRVAPSEAAVLRDVVEEQCQVLEKSDFGKTTADHIRQLVKTMSKNL